MLLNRWRLSQRNQVPTITADIVPLTSITPVDIEGNINGAGMVYIY